MREHGDQDLPARLSLDAAACLTIRRPDAGCEACAAICPAQAIGIDTRAVEIDHDLCTGCARCVASCPTGALDLPGVRPSHDALSATLECSRVAKADRAEGAQIVPCLGGVSAARLLGLLAAGASVTLVDRGWCADCSSGGCAQPWADTVQSVASDLAHLGRAAGHLLVIDAPLPFDRAQPAPPPSRPRQQGYSRRQLFRRLTTPPPAPDRSRVTTAQPFAGKVDAPALLARRENLRTLHGAGDLPAEFFPALAVTGEPDLRLAASLCPTRALTLYEEASADRLVFDAAQCLDCGDCEVAGGLALHRRGQGSHTGPETLISRAMAECPQCLRRYAPSEGQRICDGCHKDNDLAAAAFGLMRRKQVPYGA
ncbi:MAG: 4Fe-4S dicluster domain-containing protein [Pararhodobacter sp.]|nr:4Fe-4S dicluster domain-containing protein [Pararhodobacter sp.]